MKNKNLIFLAVAFFYAAVGVKSLILPPPSPVAAWMMTFPIALLWGTIAWLSWDLDKR